MKKGLFFSIISLFFLPIFAKAQIIYGAYTLDSTIISFADSSTYPANIFRDTSSTPLWQIGKTHKNFFALDTAGVRAIMTDTLNPYPVNSNNWFTLKINHLAFNQIVTFWHRYQTDSNHAGGIVEFSTDSGLTWHNMKGDCNADTGSISFGEGIHTYNFYSAIDTLATGEQCFTGSKYAQMSKFQFFEALPLERTTSGGIGCSFYTYSSVLIRFRFKSDSTVDSLAGWMIDSVSLRTDDYGGLVNNISEIQSINPYPNPSLNGSFTFPEIGNENCFTLTILNSIGSKILETPYQHNICLNQNPKGLYIYKITNGSVIKYGKLVVE